MVADIGPPPKWLGTKEALITMEEQGTNLLLLMADREDWEDEGGVLIMEHWKEVELSQCNAIQFNTMQWKRGRLQSLKGEKRRKRMEVMSDDDAMTQ